MDTRKVNKLSSKVRKPKEPAKESVIERRKWTPAENNKVLDHLIAIIITGREIEKPNAVAFYKKAVGCLQLNHCSFSQLKNQVKNLKKKYSEAIQWRDQTGQGILAEQGEASVKEIILKRCPHFDKLDEIFGGKLNISPPHLHDSATTEAMTSESQKTDVVDVETDEIELHSTDVREISENETLQDDSKMPLPAKAPIRTHNTKRKDAPQTGLAMLAKSAEMRMEMQKEQISLDREKWCDEKRRRDDLYELELKKLEQDRVIQEKKLELEEKRMDKDYDLQKFKIEQDFKLKLELAKLQNK